MRQGEFLCPIVRSPINKEWTGYHLHFSKNIAIFSFIFSYFPHGFFPNSQIFSMYKTKAALMHQNMSHLHCPNKRNFTTYLMVLSDDPLTTSRSLYWRQAIPLLCPLRVRTNSHVLVLQTCVENKEWGNLDFLSFKDEKPWVKNFGVLNMNPDEMFILWI